MKRDILGRFFVICRQTMAVSSLCVVLFLVLFSASSVSAYDSKVSPVECETLLTSVRMEVSPVLLHMICRDTNSTTLVVTCGSSVWYERVTGFCSSYDLNIGQTFMDQPLLSSTITLQLIKSGEVLDAARVAILISDHLFHYRISVWGDRNTRFVLAIAKECTPNQNEASSGTVYNVPPRFADTSAQELPVELLTKNQPPFQGHNSWQNLERPREAGDKLPIVPEYSRDNSLKRYQNRDVRKIYSQPTARKTEMSNYGIHDNVSLDDATKMETYRSKWYTRNRKENTVGTGYIPQSELGIDNDDEEDDDETTTPESSEVAKLRWMEEKRILFEQKVKFLRSFYPETSDNERSNWEDIPPGDVDNVEDDDILPASAPSQSFTEDFDNYAAYFPNSGSSKQIQTSVQDEDLYTILTKQKLDLERKHVQKSQNMSKSDKDVSSITTFLGLSAGNYEQKGSENPSGLTPREVTSDYKTLSVNSVQASANSVQTLVNSEQFPQMFPINGSRDTFGNAIREQSNTYIRNTLKPTIPAGLQRFAQKIQNSASNMPNEGMTGTTEHQKTRNSTIIALSTYNVKLLPKPTSDIFNENISDSSIKHLSQSGFQSLQSPAEDMPGRNFTFTTTTSASPDIKNSAPINLSAYIVKLLPKSMSSVFNKNTSSDLDAQLPGNMTAVKIVPGISPSEFKATLESETTEDYFSTEMANTNSTVSSTGTPPEGNHGIVVTTPEISSNKESSLSSSSYIKMKSSELQENHVSSEQDDMLNVNMVSSESQIKSDRRRDLPQVETSEAGIASRMNASDTPVLRRVKAVEATDLSLLQSAHPPLVETSVFMTPKPTTLLEPGSQTDSLTSLLLNTSAEDNVQSDDTTSDHIQAPSPSLVSKTSQAPTNTGTPQASDDSEEEMKEDSFWPIVAALVVGIPAIVVLAITITVIYRKRRTDPGKLFQMRALRSPRHTSIGTPNRESSSTLSHEIFGISRLTLMRTIHQQTIGNEYQHNMGALHKQTKGYLPEATATSMPREEHVSTLRQETILHEIPHQPSVDV